MDTHITGWGKMAGEKSIGSDTVKIRELGHEPTFKVAIVEDAANIRERLVRMVEELPGMEVVGEADSEERAVHICQYGEPDALILDMQLARGSGLGVLKAMQYPTAAKRPIIIVLTNFPSPAVEKAARELGATCFLDKSHEFGKLTSLLSLAAVNLKRNDGQDPDLSSAES